MNKLKEILPDWNCAVVKVGSALIAPDNKGCSTKYLLGIANFINESINNGKEIVLVSSGAASAGRALQNNILPNVPVSIPKKQAFAAIGQSIMMANWSNLFDFPCAQILITHDDINNRRRYVNAKNTLKELLKLKALPIVNENDTVVVQELKVGDNDNLAAHVADLVEADLLIICSDVDGLYDSDPTKNDDAEFIYTVQEINDDIRAIAGEANNPVATGGMKTKIEAALKATSRGINTIIINGKKQENFIHLLNGSVPGTLFIKQENPKTAKKHWIQHALKTEGSIYVDSGAKNAIYKKNASLLPSGILKITGEFFPGDAVKIIWQNKNKEQTLGKGITQYASKDIEKIIGVQTTEIENILGFVSSNSIVHRDDMIVELV